MIHILLVDDEKRHVEMIRRGLADKFADKEEIDLAIAGSVTQARQCLKERSPDVMILDQVLPDGRGEELLPGNYTDRSYPIIFLTAHGDEGLAVRVLKAGALDYVPKSGQTFVDMSHIVERTLREWRAISSARRAVEDLRIANARLQKTVGDLERTRTMLVRSEKLAAIGTLSSGVAHEILNPLNIISAIAQMMRKEGPEGQLKEDVDEILRQVDRATKITNSLRAFAHQREAEIREVDVHALFDETAGLIERDLKLDNIEIQREYARDLPAIRADEDQLAQVFLNLLTNARDAMKGGRNSRITLRTAVVDDGVEIRFSDTGPGIPAEITSRIFDPFFTTKDPDKGTGLGLSLVNSIIEKLGGTLRLENEPGQGAQFIITLRQEGPEKEKNP